VYRAIVVQIEAAQTAVSVTYAFQGNRKRGRGSSERRKVIDLETQISTTDHAILRVARVLASIAEHPWVHQTVERRRRIIRIVRTHVKRNVIAHPKQSVEDVVSIHGL